jgi:phage terminase large subunit-like protein
MADDYEEIDLEKIRKTAALLSAQERHRRYSKWDFTEFHAKQRELMNCTALYTSARWGNQTGKTTGAAGLITMHALNRYPSWYNGYRLVPRKVGGIHDCVILIVAPNTTLLRDVHWTRLLGDVAGEEGLGQGLIPLASIQDVKKGRGITDLIDHAIIKRDGGGTTIIFGKSYEMDRKAFQGLSVHYLWTDEDPGLGSEGLMTELLARLTATNGRWLHTATPVPGSTPFRKFWKDHPHDPERVEIRASLTDNTFIPREEIEAQVRKYAGQSDANTRLYGDDPLGFGQVFNIDIEAVKHDRDPSTFPGWWKWLAAVDFCHGGMSAQAHPFAWVVGCYDPDSQVLYIVDALRLKQMQPAQHVERICKSPVWDAPTAWGADGNQTQLGSGQTFNSLYKDRGLNMLPKHATLSDGSVSLEGGIALMNEMMSQGRLKISRHLTEIFQELADYHRDEKLRIVDKDDDLISAMRYMVMSLQHAKPLSGDTVRRPITKDQQRVINRRNRELSRQSNSEYDWLFD